MKNRIEGDLSGKEEVLRYVGLYFKTVWLLSVTSLFK